MIKSQRNSCDFLMIIITIKIPRNMNIPMEVLLFLDPTFFPEGCKTQITKNYLVRAFGTHLEEYHHHHHHHHAIRMEILKHGYLLPNF